MPNKKVLCLDFDGVLHDYASHDWEGYDVIKGGPVPGALDFCWKAQKQFDLQIFSSRNKYHAGLLAMKRWLKRYGFPMMKFPRNKPPAFLFIDDRAMCFTGTFPELGLLKKFKPWHNRDVDSVHAMPE